VFGKLRDLDGKIMVIGLSYNNSMTFFHHIEQMEGVDYRFLKQFTGEVTDWEWQHQSTDTFEMLVRDIDKGVITKVNPMGAVDGAGRHDQDSQKDWRCGCETDEGE
jgi:aminoglycoside 3-N-acetyltransferase